MLERRAAPSVSEISFWTLVFAALAGAIYGWCAPQFEAAVGLPAIDIDGASAPARTLALMEGYGVHGRQAYLVFLSRDCLLPVAGSLLLLRLYYAATREWAWTQLRRRSLVTIGALPAISDLTENTLYALLASLYPRHAGPLAELAYLATVFKLASAVLALLTLLVLAALRLRRRVNLSERANEGTDEVTPGE